MPGAAAAAPREGQRRGGRNHLPKRSASSASSLQRERRDVVITSYTPVDNDLPPLPAPTSIPRSKSTATLRTASHHHHVRRPHRSSSDARTEARGVSPDSTTSSGVSSACPSPPREKTQRSPHKRSTSSTRHSSSATEENASSGSSSASTSPGTNMRLDEDDLTCAICLDLLHRPRSLPCGHTFCLVCLQNYVNSCRTMFTCPSCRGAAQVPREGVMALPTNTTLAKGAQILRERRQGNTGTLICASCQTSLDVRACDHCKEAWCVACSAGHLQQVQADLAELQERLASARDTLYCRAEEDEVSHV